MGRNQVIKRIYNVDQNWTAPAGVTSVKVSAMNPNIAFQSAGVGGNSYTFGNTSGQLYSMGNNFAGCLGVNDTTPRSSPVAVVGGFSFVYVAGSGAQAYALLSTGACYSWGQNANGELGIGNVTNQSSPTPVVGGLTFTKVAGSHAASSGSCFVLFLTAAGAAYACGRNLNGQLGVNDVTPRSSPVAVVGGLTFSQISANDGSFGMGMTTGGAVYCWGFNGKGQLGDNTTTAKSSPVAVVGGLTFTAIAGGGSGTGGYAGGLVGGAAYMWGSNDNGQLGNGDVTARSSPVAVLGGLTFSYFECSGGSAYGITAAGALYAWGLNTSGQLGLGDVTPRSSPVAVLGGLTFAAVYAGQRSVMGITTDGALYAWGSNANGELGVGDVTPRSSPVAVLKPGTLALTAGIFLNSAQITVTPGTTYAVQTLGQAAFGGSLVYASGAKNLVLLEYFE